MAVGNYSYDYNGETFTQFFFGAPAVGSDFVHGANGVTLVVDAVDTVNKVLTVSEA